jgi:outer membrane protein assembly factor BamB
VRANPPAPIYQHILGAWAIVALAAAPAQAQVRDSWPMVGGNPAHTGVAGALPAPYRQVWSTKIGEPGPVAAPVVLEGTVVVVAEQSVVGLSAETGEIQWKERRVPGPAGPAAADGELVINGEGTGPDAFVRASLEDGEEGWRFETKSPVVGGVTVEDGRAYFGGRDGTVHAIDIETGKEDWSFQAPGRVETPLAAAEGLVFLVSEGFKTGLATAYALDASTGKEEWTFSPERVAVGASSVTVGDDLVVFGLGDLRVHAVELESGVERWSARSRAPFSARTVPSFDGDVLIADRLGHLYRLDATSGEELWVFRLPGNFLTGSPVITGQTALIGDSSGQLSAIHLTSGHLVWKEQISDQPIGGVAAVDERIFVSSADGSVVAMEQDPEGVLLDEASPTTLFVGRALLNFAVAFAALLFGLTALFRWVYRRPQTQPAENP